jgi:hypothetical protein
MEVHTCPIPELSAGMIIHQEVRTNAGLLIVAKGQEVTFPLIVKLKNFHQKKAITGSVVVLAPRGTTTSASAAGAS